MGREFGSKNKHGKPKYKKGNCIVCDSELFYYISRPHKFCSHHCYWKDVTGKNKRKWTEAERKAKVGRFTGVNSWSWRGGISNNPYPKEFNRTLKLKIRTRDGFICYLCKKSEEDELRDFNRVLCVNHIDFNKNNCSEDNLNTLCLRCNLKINRQREYWTDYFNQKI